MTFVLYDRNISYNSIINKDETGKYEPANTSRLVKKYNNKIITFTMYTKLYKDLFNNLKEKNFNNKIV